MIEQIAGNRRKTAALITLFVLLVVALGWALSLLLRGGPALMVIAAVIAVVVSFTSYYSSDRIVLAVSGAKEADRATYARYHNLVEGVCIAAGIAKPRLYVINSDSPNAFATGRNPAHSAIAVTTGLLDKLNRVEIEGVLAHEMAHIKNEDVRLMAVVATLAGLAALVADWGLRALFWGGGRRGARDAERVGGVYLLPLALVLIILAPLASQIIRFAISRRREFQADASGVYLTRYPPGLISALGKISADPAPLRQANVATQHLWISEPTRKHGTRGSWWERAFSTHPPIEERIAALKDL
ncbi:MAG: M48 family metallopeptidase [Actinomycetota bacterium]